MGVQFQLSEEERRKEGRKEHLDVGKVFGVKREKTTILSALKGKTLRPAASIGGRVY